MATGTGAGPTPRTKNWKAWEDRMPTIGERGPTLRVTGKVEVSASSLSPQLKEQIPPGINPSNLLLDLVIVKSGDIGNPVMTWKEASYAKRLNPGQYDKISILWQETPIAEIKVEIVH